MSVTLKHGDQVPLTLTVGVNLTGATVRVLARRGSGDTIVLPNTVTDLTGGVIVHNTDGTLEVGNYDVEVEITRNGKPQTAPSSGYARLTVARDLG